MKTAKLWTRNFRLVILASAMGTIGAIAGSFALAFLVFDETGSTLASALIVAIQLLPYLLLPVLIAPLMDRLPRKAFLVAGDLANAILLAGMGLWLMAFDFSYVGYLALSLLLGAVVMLLGYCFGPRLLGLMNTPESCLDDAVLYIKIYFGGAIASMLYNMGAGILRAMGDSRRPTVFLMAACGVNIVLDIVCVVVLKMGVAGAAIATVFSQVVSAGMVTVALLRQPEETRLSLKKIRFQGELLKRILYVGVPAGLQFVTFDLANTLIQSGINSFGDVAVAAWTAYVKTDSLTWMISGAFGVSVTTFVGQNFGAQKYDRIRQSVWVCMGMSVALTGAMSALVIAFRPVILGIYTTDPAVIRLGVYVMAWTVPFNVLFMPVEVFAGAMRGTGCSVLPTVITCVCVCVFRVVWIFTVVRTWHRIELLAVCYPLSWLLAATVFSIVYFQGGWLRRRIAQCGMEPEVRV